MGVRGPVHAAGPAVNCAGSSAAEYLDRCGALAAAAAGLSGMMLAVTSPPALQAALSSCMRIISDFVTAASTAQVVIS